MSYSMDSQWEKQLDHYLTTPPEEMETHFFCELCKEPIFPGDSVYYIESEDETYCKDCAEKWLEDQRRTATYDDCYGEDGDY